MNIDLEQNHAKGSARSIEQVSMFEILSAHQDLISKFGGHHMAAGMTMEIDYIEALEQGLNDWMFKLSEHTSLEPTKHVSVKLEENDISINNIRDIQRLSPFGTDFENHYWKLMIMKSLMLEQLEKIKPFKISNRSVTITKHILENGQLATQIEPGQPINLLGNLQINEWNGNQSPQFIIQDIATNNEQILDYRSKRKQLNIDPNDTKVAF